MRFVKIYKMLDFHLSKCLKKVFTMNLEGINEKKSFLEPLVEKKNLSVMKTKTSLKERLSTIEKVSRHSLADTLLHIGIHD